LRQQQSLHHENSRGTSASFWPYEKQLLENYKSELEVFPEDILAGSVYVATSNQNILGFYTLSSDKKKHRLHFLFVDPTFMGMGYGKALWQHAISTARQRGWSSLSFYADSYASRPFKNTKTATVRNRTIASVNNTYV